MNNNRREGQIWIDRNAPYNLKYHIKNEDFVVENHSTYAIKVPDESSEDYTKFVALEIGSTWIPAGTLLSINNKGDITKAKFPDDLENVLGIVINDVKKIKDDSLTEAIISHDGLLTVKKENIEKVFKDSFENLKLGDVVYWFIGRIEEDHSFTEPSNFKGKLTVYTPCGLKGNESADEAPEDNSLNLTYSNLPQIGVITEKNEDESSVKIHLNFSKFNSSIEYHWPGIHKENNACGKIVENKSSNPETIVLRHGLFSKYEDSTSFNPKCSCNIIALKKHENEGEIVEEETILAPISNYPEGDDRRTEVSISTPEDVFIRINGRVSYKFDRGKN